AHAEGILEIVAGAGTVAVDGDGEALDAQFRHLKQIPGGGRSDYRDGASGAPGSSSARMLPAGNARLRSSSGGGLRNAMPTAAPDPSSEDRRSTAVTSRRRAGAPPNTSGAVV